MKIYNNNPAFGDGGPFEAESFEALADEVEDLFNDAAREEYEALVMDSPGEEFIPSRESYEASARERLRKEFIDGLTVVHLCPDCGQEYHEDASERGHADGCPLR